jgi:hypothetical protein
VQQELIPRVSVEVGYSRRWWGNLTVTDNLAVGPSDFDVYTRTSPTNAELPSSGQQLSYYLRNSRTPFGAVDNYLTLASNYGDVTYYWQGLDLTATARTTNSLTLQGGFTSGAGVRDQCDIWNALPEVTTVLGVTNRIDACRIEEPWLWNWRGLITYVVPKVDVQVSGIIRSQSNTQNTNDPASTGLSMQALYFEPNSAVLAALGRPIAGGATTVTLDLAKLGQVYPDRLNTVDMRFTKIVRFGRTRTNIGIDLYNLFNANTGTGFNQNYGTDGSTWLRPNAILNPRYLRFNATVDF